MSYYFSILTPRDRPLFSLELGTCKGGGDGVPRFSPEARAMNPFIVHAALDMVDEVFWNKNNMYLRRIDAFSSAHVSCFLTPTSTRFMLLHLPHLPNISPPPPQRAAGPNAFPPFLPYTSNPSSTSTSTSTTGSAGTSLNSSRLALAGSSITGLGSSSGSITGGGGSSAGGIPNNPTSPQTEEAIRLFFWEVFENWIKACLSPFAGADDVEGGLERSAVFRAKVVGAGKKYL